MACPFAKYSDIFGKPKTGVHSYRIKNIAIVDILATVILSGLLSYSLNYNFIIVFIILFILGIIMHALFCVDTTINLYLKSLFK
jgi:hypothetical protein